MSTPTKADQIREALEHAKKFVKYIDKYSDAKIDPDEIPRIDRALSLLADLDGGGEVVAWIGPMALRDIERGHDPVVGCEQSEDNPFPLYRHPSPTAADAPPEAERSKPQPSVEEIMAIVGPLCLGEATERHITERLTKLFNK